MKNTIKIIGIIAIVSIIGFAMTACEEDDGVGGGVNIPSELHGTWELEGPGDNTITFTKTTVKATGMLAGFQTSFDAVKDTKGVKVTFKNGEAILVVDGTETPWFDYEVTGSTLKISAPGMMQIAALELTKK